MLSSPEKCVENYPVSYCLEVCQYDLHSNSDPHTHWQDTRGNHISSLVGERAEVLLVLVIQLHVVPLSSLNSNFFLEQMRVLNSNLFLYTVVLTQMPLCEATQYQSQHSEVFWSTPAQKICEWIKNEEEFKNLGKNKHCSQAYFTMGWPGIRGEDPCKMTKIGNSCECNHFVSYKNKWSHTSLILLGLLNIRDL